MNFSSKTRFSALALILLLFLPHFVFVWASHNIWAWDQAWYGEESFHAWNILLHQPSQYLSVLLHQFGFKAPLVSWIGQWFAGPAYAFNEPHVILVSVPLAGAAATYLLWNAFEEDRPAAAVAVLFSISMPLFFGLQREFVVETLQFLSVSILVFLSYHRKQFDFWPLFFYTLFGVTLGLGAKVSTPLYQVFWGLLISHELGLKARAGVWGKSFQARHLVICLFFALVCAWYVINLNSITQFLKEASSGTVATLYGSASPFWLKLKFWTSYFCDGIAGGRSLSLTGLVLLVLVFLRLRKSSSIILVVIALQIALPLFVFSFQINEETRYLLPIFPSVVAAIFEISRQGSLGPRLRWIPLGLALISVFRFLELNLVSLHQWPNASRTSWVSYFQDRTQRNVLLHLIDRTCTVEGEQSIVGVDRRDMNNVTLNFYLSARPGKAQLQCSYHSLGYAAASVDVSWRYIQRFHFRNFITYDAATLEKWKDPFNQTSSQVAERIRSDPSFKKTEEFSPIQLFTQQ